jgi:two-component system response regulator HydG
LLDEVGNLSIDLQSKLLSVLQNREVIPLGGSKPRQIDIRLLCATNVDIHRSVDEGDFRQDLLFRINTVEITVPPLRDRLEDIPALANYFMNLYGTKYRKQRTISQEALKHLCEHRWPGNIRELQHAIERAVIMSDHDQLSPTDFLLAKSSEPHHQRESLNLDEMEKKTIIAAIQKYQGNMSKVAKELGVGRTTLYRKLTRYGLAK